MLFAEFAVTFQLGRVVITPGALRKICQKDIDAGLSRHKTGDWGDLDEQDWRENDESLSYGGRLFSRYPLQDGSKFWIITECDRSVTTILLPNEY